MEKKGFRLKPQNKYFVLLVVWFPNFVPLKMDVNFLIVLEKKKKKSHKSECKEGPIHGWHGIEKLKFSWAINKKFQD